MAKSKAEFVGVTDEKGKMQLYGRSALDHFLAEHPKSRFTITFKKNGNGKEGARRGFYFATIIPQLQHGLANRGYNYDSQGTHDFVKTYCPVMRKYNEINGKSELDHKHLDDLDKDEFQQYLEELGMFAAENLDIILNTDI